MIAVFGEKKKDVYEAADYVRDAHREDRWNVTSMITKRTVLEEILAYNL